MPQIRKFNQNANRDSSDGKYEYVGFRNPVCEFSFAKYMHKHRKQSDGELRTSNNWWGGWDKQVSLDCLIRHVVDLELLHYGRFVYKERNNEGETTHHLPKRLNKIPKGWYEVTKEDACNAIRFNADAYKLQLLKELEKKNG